MKSITILLLHMQHGGIEKQTITLANQLAKKYRVDIISTYSMNKEPAYPLDSRVSVKYLIDTKPNRDEFKAAVKSKNPFKIFKEGLRAVKILRAKNALMKKAIKNLSCDYVLSTRIEFADLLSKYAPAGVTTVTQEHLHDDSEKYIKYVKRAFSKLDYLVVLCDGSEENYSKWLSDNNRINIVRIPNILEEISENSAEISSNRIVSVGRLHPVKDFGTLIKVFEKVKKSVPDAYLTIVGGGDEEESLKRAINEAKLSDSVKLTGMVSKEEVAKYMLSSDIYAMTSLTECFPMVLLEASAAGLPLIAFDVPVGPKAIIENGKNGYLIADRDIDAMAEKIISMLRQRDELKSLAINSKEMAKNYLSENIMPLWYDLFE